MLPCHFHGGVDIDIDIVAFGEDVAASTSSPRFVLDYTSSSLRLSRTVSPRPTFLEDVDDGDHQLGLINTNTS